MPKVITFKMSKPITELMYSVKERRKVVVTNPTLVKLNSNRYALTGKCPHSGFACFKMISRDRAKEICPEID